MHSGFERLIDLPRLLDARILGQKSATSRLARAVQAAELGLNQVGSRPKGSFLLLGPTGVGKTESAKCLTEALFGTGSRLEMLFMNEYSADQRLCEFLNRTEAAIGRHPHGATLLFDEIEKGHPQAIDVLLSVLEEGVFTALSGERLRLNRFYLVMTSNLGSGDLAKMENAPATMMERVALDVASQALRPEFFARITERIVFRPLDLETQKQILYNLVTQKLGLLSNFFEQSLTIDNGPVAAFLLRVGYNRTYGARLLRQEVDRQFNAASLPWALAGQTPGRGLFRYDAAVGGLVLE
ncbi:MAG: ATP-dependent Clp protease ATP-binding subunit [Verrucomicrobia bacterium]|nr:ATP-dependent Clp protease ATP-binding subunit [Verrucomicrobiota bacterium]